ncbi:MAG TPA: DUF4349 domain-containing protein [Anaerolineales bacterium]|nr:DUF4349 domain-containing protein [Anaerolineales bacterium]
MKRVLFIILAVVVVFVLIGLSFAGMASQRSFATEAPPGFGFGGGGGAPEVAMEEMPAAAPAFDSSTGSDAVKSVDFYAQNGQERLVIRNADLAIVVQDPEERMAAIASLANRLGGYVVSSNLYQSFTNLGKEVPEASIVIRVPAERLDEALAEIKEGAVDINYENVSGQDVTSIYVDLQSQLKAKEAAEQKLLEIMDEATRAEDVLAIYLQVQSIQTEIEQLKGQIKYYEESAALSSISVRLVAEESTQPIVVGPWKPEGAAKAAVEDLIRFLQNFAEFLIRFVIFTLPALILIAIPLYLVYLGGRALFRRYNRSKVVVEEVEKKS